MKIFLYILDGLAALWIIGAFVVILMFSVFLFDDPHWTIVGFILTFAQMFFYIAGIPVGWVLIRILNRRRTNVSQNR